MRARYRRAGLVLGGYFLPQSSSSQFSFHLWLSMREVRFMSKRSFVCTLLLATALMALTAATGFAEDPPAPSTPAAPTVVPEWKFAADTTWVMITASLV